MGRALAGALDAAGARVVRVARTSGEGVDRCDVSDPAEVEALHDRIGSVDLLVNNAGVIHEPAPLVDLPIEEWRRILDTNVLGTVAMIRAFLPEMNARGSGMILNLSSTWGRIGAGRQAPYCASKFAVEGLTESLAAEVATGVAVLAVNPGVVATEMLATCFEGDVSGHTPPEVCAAQILRLLSAATPGWNGRSLDATDF